MRDSETRFRQTAVLMKSVLFPFEGAGRESDLACTDHIGYVVSGIVQEKPTLYLICTVLILTLTTQSARSRA